LGWNGYSTARTEPSSSDSTRASLPNPSIQKLRRDKYLLRDLSHLEIWQLNNLWVHLAQALLQGAESEEDKKRVSFIISEDM